MARKTSIRRREKTTQNQGLFSDLHDYAEKMNGTPDPNPQEKTATTESDRIAALERLVDTLQRQTEATEAANLALTTRAVEPQAPTAPAGVDFSGLPDPVEQPAEYGQQLQGRIDKMIQDRMQYDRDLRAHHGAQAQTKDVLWLDFQEQYPEYAEDEERVGFVTQQVLKRAAARGLDTNRYMTGNTNRFFKDVVKEFDKVFGEPEEQDDDYEDEPAPRRRAQAQRRDADPEPRNRTGGILGGVDGGAGRRRASADPLDDGPGDMVKELQDVQRTRGYY